MQLYKLKLQLGSHIVKVQFVGDFLLPMTTYLWILKTHRCYNVLFVEQNKYVLMICTNDLIFEKVLSNISLMGSFL
jgi:hypothetical protein